jgi:hypothetical protein
MNRFMILFAGALCLCLLTGVTTMTNAQIAFTSNQLTSNALDDGAMDVATDADGNSHSVYTRDGNVYYQRNLDGEILVGAGSDPAIAVTPGGIAHVVYIAGGLVVYKHNGSGSWSAGTSLANGSSSFVDIDVTGTGKAHIVYYCNADGDGYGEIVYATNTSGSFVETVMADGWYADGGGNYFYNPNIKVDVNGKYHIVYEQQNWGGRASWSSKNLTLLTDAATGSGGSESFDWNAGVTTGKNSLALDALGNAYVLYYSGSTMYFGVMGSSWTGGALGTGSQGAIAVSGTTVAIAYNDGTGHIVYNEGSGASFGTPQTLDAGTYPSLALGAHRLVGFQKSDGTDQEIMLLSDGGVLPVQLASFTVAQVADGVVLRWRTVSEVNNYGFTVQRRGNDGVTYTDIPGSFIAGHGTTTEGQVYAYVDANPQGDGWYRLSQTDLDGRVQYSEPIQISSVTGVATNAPVTFSLSQNYPNPFNPATQISFGIAVAGQAQLVVYDQLGREVATLVDGVLPAGQHAAAFNAAGLASGVYFARLTSGAQTSMIRMMLMK